MFALVAAVPIVAVIVLMLGFNRPAKQALPIGWFLTVLAALFVWHQNWYTTAAWAADGFLEAIGTFAIIAGAILIMNTMKVSGAMGIIERMFISITPDRRIQAIIIGFVFEAFLEGAAGFGTPAAIAAPLMIALGFPPICAAIISLIFNTTPVNFGVVGVPTMMALDCTRSAAVAAGASPEAYTHAISLWCAIADSAVTFFIVFAGIFTLCRMRDAAKPSKMADALRDTLPALPFMLFTTVVFVAFFLPLAYFFGPEYPSLVGGLLTLAITCFAAKKRFLCPRTNWDFAQNSATNAAETGAATAAAATDEPQEKTSLGRILFAWLPYILIIVILAASRLDLFGLMGMLKGDACTFGYKSVIGHAGVDWRWNWGWCPGIVPFTLVAFLTFAIYRVSPRKIAESFAITARQCAGAGVALFFGVSMVYLYRNTGMNAQINESMLLTLAKGLAGIFSSAYVLIAPIIGVLGAFMSGSNTVSNTLFAGLQFDIAVMVKLSPVLIVALQNIGSAYGNMICVNNVVAVCATTGTSGREGVIIRNNLPITFIACLIAFLILGTACYLGVDPLNLLEGGGGNGG